MTPFARRSLLAAGGLVALPGRSLLAQQSWPDRSVRLMVAFAPGGSTDIVARIIGEKLSQVWGRPTIIENRGGAGGNVATQMVARSRPDGQVALVTTSAFAVNPSMSRNPGYRPDELVPAALLASTPNLLVVRPDFPARTVEDLVAYSRSKPLDYGSGGIGTPPHLSVERLFRTLARADAQHIPFTGAGPAVTATLAGQIALATVTLPSAMEMVRQGTLRGLAVTSARRSAALPDVPTLAELGYPEVDDVTWTAMFFPAETAAAVVAKCNADCNAALADPETGRKLVAVGFDPMGGSPEAARRYVMQEVQRWAEIVRIVGITPD